MLTHPTHFLALNLAAAIVVVVGVVVVVVCVSRPG